MEWNDCGHDCQNDFKMIHNMPKCLFLVFTRKKWKDKLSASLSSSFRPDDGSDTESLSLHWFLVNTKNKILVCYRSFFKYFDNDVGTTPAENDAPAIFRRRK